MDKAAEIEPGSRTPNAPSSEEITHARMKFIGSAGHKSTCVSSRDCVVFNHHNRFIDSPLPRADVITRGTEISVVVVLPGVDKYIDISISKVSARYGQSSDHYRCEISRGECSVSVSLPADVDTSRTKVSFMHDVLELVMPKVEAVHGYQSRQATSAGRFADQ
jgi:HSP20 family molecular chaperone IbpA